MSYERLERLVLLAKSWDGPISVGMSIKKPKVELPMIINAWLNNECMRKNADVHILFEDNVGIIATL